VEGITKRFLRTHFTDDAGNLYEGQGADFLGSDWTGFQLKTNTVADDRTNLERVKEALLVAIPDRLAAISALVDMDAYFTYWAMEALTAHWDSYSTTRNNYFLYDDPASGFHFIPWGADATLAEEALTGGARPQSISADSDLSRGLFDIPEARARYIERVRELLDDVWDVDVILAEVERVAAAVPDADPDEVERVREFVRRRREVVIPELDAGPEPLAASSICFNPGARISGIFSGAWAAEGGGTFSVVVDGTPLAITDPVVTGSPLQLAGPPGVGATLGGTLPDGTAVQIRLEVESKLFTPGTVRMHGLSDLGFVQGLPAPGSPFPFQFIGDGTIDFTAAGVTPGDPVSGAFEGRTYTLRL
jgi:hypothetical protein